MTLLDPGHKTLIKCHGSLNESLLIQLPNQIKFSTKLHLRREHTVEAQWMGCFWRRNTRKL